MKFKITLDLVMKALSIVTIILLIMTINISFWLLPVLLLFSSTTVGFLQGYSYHPPFLVKNGKTKNKIH